MKTCALAAAVAAASARAGEVSPLGQALEMLSDLQSKIIGEGEEAHKVYAEFAEFCEDRYKNVGFDIRTGKSQVSSLKATIDEATALVSELTAKVEQLTADIAKDEADLKAAIGIRTDEAADFAAEEKELKEIVGTLERAIGFVSKKMKGASMAQLQGARGIADALNVLVQASVFSSADADRLTSLAQTAQEGAGAVEDNGAPAGAVYKDHSGGVVATLEDLLDKAQEQLDGAVKKETVAVHNFEMLRQSLENEIKFANKELSDAQKGIASNSETKALAQGDLDATSKVLREDIATNTDLHKKCQSKAADYEAETKSRDEEVRALTEAKRLLKEATGAALEQVSFLQRDGATRLQSDADLAHFEAVRFVRDLARKTHSTELAQLAKQMASAVRAGARADQDPFSKVKGLISDLITKLESDAETDASHKAYCDKELGETNTKKEDKTNEIEKLSTQISQMSSRSAKLKEEAAGLQSALAEIAKSQADMDRMRADERSLFQQSKATTDKGLDGVKLALKVLKEYYGFGSKAHAAASDSAGGIISLLEVVEADLSKSLSELVAAEESAQVDYDAESKENELTKTMKEQDVKYKTEEYHGLDKSVAEASADREGVQAELNALGEYKEKLQGMCVEKAEPYEERASRREAEVAGLKQALEILSGEAVLLQRAHQRSLRGVQRHAA